jgi:predicted GTPase
LVKSPRYIKGFVLITSIFDGGGLGESGLGKSTLVNTLFNTQLYPPKEDVELTHETSQTVEIKSITSDIEENGVKLRLTVVDTPGFGDFVNNEERYARKEWIHYVATSSFSPFLVLTIAGSPSWTTSNLVTILTLNKKTVLIVVALWIIASMLVSTSSPLLAMRK